MIPLWLLSPAHAAGLLVKVLDPAGRLAPPLVLEVRDSQGRTLRAIPRDDGVAPDQAAGDGAWTAAPPAVGPLYQLVLHDARSRTWESGLLRADDPERPLLVVAPGDAGILEPATDRPPEPASEGPPALVKVFDPLGALGAGARVELEAEGRRVRLALRDDGQDPDLVAGDATWAGSGRLPGRRGDLAVLAPDGASWRGTYEVGDGDAPLVAVRLAEGGALEPTGAEEAPPLQVVEAGRGLLLRLADPDALLAGPPRVVLVDGLDRSVTLEPRDDGSSPDAAPGDALYTAALPPTADLDPTGTLRVKVVDPEGGRWTGITTPRGGEKPVASLRLGEGGRILPYAEARLEASGATDPLAILLKVADPAGLTTPGWLVEVRDPSGAVHQVRPRDDGQDPDRAAGDGVAAARLRVRGRTLRIGLTDAAGGSWAGTVTLDAGEHPVVAIRPTPTGSLVPLDRAAGGPPPPPPPEDAGGEGPPGPWSVLPWLAAGVLGLAAVLVPLRRHPAAPRPVPAPPPRPGGLRRVRPRPEVVDAVSALVRALAPDHRVLVVGPPPAEPPPAGSTWVLGPGRAAVDDVLAAIDRMGPYGRPVAVVLAAPLEDADGSVGEAALRRLARRLETTPLFAITDQGPDHELDAQGGLHPLAG